MKIGIDIVDTNRFKSGNLSRIFSESEISYANKFASPHIHLAGFWCAKEAFLKAYGTGITSLNLSDIYVDHASSGAPTLVIPDSFNIPQDKIKISISHTNDTATAICIIE